MSDPIRLLLVDDQALFREGLKTLLELDERLQIVGEACNGIEAVAQAKTIEPHVILMDLNMPQMDGVEATRLIKEASPEIHVLVLTTFDNDERVFDALKAGASGYLLKDTPSQQVIEAALTVSRGQSFLQPSIASKVLAEFNRLSQKRRPQPQALAEPLSQREQEVLSWLAKGYSNKEIAAQLHLAEGTVKNHVSNILGKMGVYDRTQAALKATKLGLI